MTLLSEERTKLGATATDKQDAIRQAAAILVESGCVKEAYAAGMLEREATMSTYLGNGVAIPHGMHENRADIIENGLSIVQFPAGVLWEDDELAYLVIGIAATGDAHMGILSSLAEAIEDEEAVQELAQTTDKSLIIERLSAQPEF